MLLLELFTLLLLVAILLTWLAQRIRVPYPIVLVIGGAALGFVPGLPSIPFNPNLILAVVLPPILFAAAHQISFRDFKRQARSIGILAIGLVVATTLALGVILKWLLPDVPWAVAFAFGAIVSPPDAVAATAIMSRLNAPRILVTTLEGESLLNDASGLVLYKFAVAAALTGVFSMTAAIGNFIFVAAGGVVLGLVIGWMRQQIDRRLDDTLLVIVFSMVAPYAAYLAAEQLHVSGVLTVVTAGLMGARDISTDHGPERRLMGRATWQVLVILLNSLVFILMGTRLSGMLATIPQDAIVQRLLDAVLLSLAAIAVRMIWVFPGAYLPRLFDQWVLKKSPWFPPWQTLIVLGWSGMRGIVSVAAALALPLMLDDDTPFPMRDEVIFLAFMVTIFTLVLPGLTLAPLMRRLGVKSTAAEHEELRDAREQTTRAALNRLTELQADGTLSEDVVTYLKRDYEAQLVCALPASQLLGPTSDPYYIGRHAALAAQRHRLLELSRTDVIGDEVLHEIERDLDFEETRIATSS